MTGWQHKQPNGCYLMSQDFKLPNTPYCLIFLLIFLIVIKIQHSIDPTMWLKAKICKLSILITKIINNSIDAIVFYQKGTWAEQIWRSIPASLFKCSLISLLESYSLIFFLAIVFVCIIYVSQLTFFLLYMYIKKIRMVDWFWSEDKKALPN